MVTIPTTTGHVNGYHPKPPRRWDDAEPEWLRRWNRIAANNRVLERGAADLATQAGKPRYCGAIPDPHAPAWVALFVRTLCEAGHRDAILAAIAPELIELIDARIEAKGRAR